MTWTGAALESLKETRAALLLMAAAGRLSERGKVRMGRVDFALLYLWSRIERTGVRA
jgi:hypothetical protein